MARRVAQGSTARDGMVASVPVAVALVPVALAFGYAADAAGLSWWLAGLMSALVYAGPSQFLAVGMIGAGAAVPAVVATTLVANLRYVLFAVTLAPHLRDTPRRRLPALSHAIVDGSYAVTLVEAAARPGRPRLDRFLAGSFAVSFGAWVPASVAGALIGDALPRLLAFGLEFATPAIFIAFLVVLVRDRIGVLVAVVAGAGTVAGDAHLAPGLGPLVSILVAACLGGTLAWRRGRR